MESLIFFLLLSLAAIFDLKMREIPDVLSALLACVCLLTEDGVMVWGMLPAFLLLIVGVTIGGIGGGDIKVVAACGVVTGLWNTTVGLFISLCLLLLFHEGKRLYTKRKKKIEIADKEQAYPLVPFLLLGMLISTRFVI